MSTDIPFSTADNVTALWNDTDRGPSTEDPTQVSGLNFVDSFVKALSVMIVSELGDKTFFLSAILAMRYNKLVIFIGSIAALIIMTVVSALVGFGITSFIPPIYTYYAAIVIMFLFGFKMFWDAYKMKPDEGEQLQQEVEDEIDNLHKKISKPHSDQSPPDSESSSGSNNNLNGNSKSMVNQLFSSIQFWKSQHPNESSNVSLRRVNSKTSLNPKNHDENAAEEGSLIPSDDQPQTSKQKFLTLFKIFINTFGLIFIAEWGDRSQLATIVLASANNVGGIILGSILGHTICTSLAVIAGALVARWISVRVVTVIGGIVFISFAIASLVIGYEDPASTIEAA